ncbi:hypothetical protein [Phycobacter azelaicus]|uniref:hypothetical protein n=1 Tax=Phycobacter azelaicus TaxID=2668075 RepID=UPI001867CE1E|nr:hypothetical protein [Phycobacter azelaicus]
MPRDFTLTLPQTAFILNHGEALCSATALLGGYAAERRFKNLYNDMCLRSSTTRRLERELDWLEDLLGLEHVHDFDRIEAELFAEIDPSDPVVAEICLLLDGLRDARRASRAA